ncbi:hypothetical protein A2973_04560 [Candidatus Gottesmanbacteria bacterium RIFCSPLOWO2_01_FULL_49_10]|uniref:Uncharacterized protein n=1 Tax=Candidatus Gottesmanbacteria bacterium RIFCSPLOWO2_01_FULL_49_10 TaxID=1798396 RepID=A0A1F6B0Q8_9BACT|nr:MAG: hypothetical protein A2973_04560 [Candidatus Gottesmanbacteria bacterium RIFCSPLOWO2_01_FULL_49_10]
MTAITETVTGPSVPLDPEGKPLGGWPARDPGLSGTSWIDIRAKGEGGQLHEALLAVTTDPDNALACGEAPDESILIIRAKKA